MPEREVPKTRMEIIREQANAYHNLPAQAARGRTPTGDIHGTRQCRTCWKTKPADEMVRRHYRCKECHAKYMKAYREEHPRVQKEAKERYYEKNKEKYREYQRNYYAKRKAEIAEYRAWKAAQEATQPAEGDAP